MGDSYDDKIETILVTRKRVAEQRRAQRQKELQKQLIVLLGALVVLIIVIVLIFSACNGDKKTTSKDKKTKETTSVEITTVVKETTPEKATTVQEEITTEDASQVTSGTMYTTDILNFRTEPSIEGELIRHLDKGTEVQVISTDNGWCNIKYGDHTGYVSAEYLSDTKPE